MKTLADLLTQLSRAQRPDLLWVRDGGSFRPVSSRTFGASVQRCGQALARMEIDKGDRIGRICHNRPEWHVVDFAAHSRGAILVPLFGTLTPVQVQFILADSGCRVVFLEGREQLDKVAAVHDGLPELERVVYLEPLEGEVGAEPVSVDLEPVDLEPADLEPVDLEPADLERADPESADAREVVLFEEFMASASEWPDGELPGPDGPDAVATMIYTSGTTGDPKGVMLTHGNLISNVTALLQVLPCAPDERALSVLPLCHVFQRTVDYTFLAGGGSIGYGSPQHLGQDLRRFRPTVMVGVPRLYERLRDAVLDRVSRGGNWRRRLFAWAERAGLRAAEARLGGTRLSGFERLRYAIADVLVLRRVRAGTGGKLRYFTSGGAALDPGLNWWFEAMGLSVLQGYGLTESSPVIAVNRPETNRIGTVGEPLPGVEVRIAEDGEILTRGPHIMKGYWKRPAETAEAVVDGWLHTGDVGTLDDDGYLRVTDRKKHLLVTSTGKNVAPQPLENSLAQSPYIEHVAVVGDGRKFVAGLIVPHFPLLNAWAEERGLRLDPSSLCKEAAVIELIQMEVDRQQVDFAPYERVRAFRLLETPFSIEEGTLTPTLKAVRRVVEAKYAGLIDHMYRGAEADREARGGRGARAAHDMRPGREEGSED